MKIEKDFAKIPNFILRGQSELNENEKALWCVIKELLYDGQDFAKTTRDQLMKRLGWAHKRLDATIASMKHKRVLKVHRKRRGEVYYQILLPGDLSKDRIHAQNTAQDLPARGKSYTAQDLPARGKSYTAQDLPARGKSYTGQLGVAQDYKEKTNNKEALRAEDPSSTQAKPEDLRTAIGELNRLAAFNAVKVAEYFRQQDALEG